MKSILRTSLLKQAIKTILNIQPNGNERHNKKTKISVNFFQLQKTQTLKNQKHTKYICKLLK
jgi:hypothetical protein